MKPQKDIRYYINSNLKSKKLVSIGSGDKNKLIKDMPEFPIHRIFLTKGQYNRLKTKI